MFVERGLFGAGEVPGGEGSLQSCAVAACSSVATDSQKPTSARNRLKIEAATTPDCRPGRCGSCNRFFAPTNSTVDGSFVNVGLG